MAHSSGEEAGMLKLNAHEIIKENGRYFVQIAVLLGEASPAANIYPLSYKTPIKLSQEPKGV